MVVFLARDVIIPGQSAQSIVFNNLTHFATDEYNTYKIIYCNIIGTRPRFNIKRIGTYTGMGIVGHNNNIIMRCFMTRT